MHVCSRAVSRLPLATRGVCGGWGDVDGAIRLSARNQRYAIGS